jgi:hypothetical protein
MRRPRSQPWRRRMRFDETQAVECSIAERAAGRRVESKRGSAGLLREEPVALTPDL